MPRVLVVSAEPVGPRMAGPAIRAYELARALAGTAKVTLAAPAPSQAPEGVALVEAGYADYGALLAAAAAADVVVAQLLPPRLLARIAALPARLVADLYNPIVVEVLEGTRHKPPASRARLRAAVTAGAVAHLAAADLVLCASEAQRDLWLGVMAARGLLAPEEHPEDPALRALLAVVPFGVPAEPPAADTDPLRRAFPAIAPGDRVLLWGGGIWDWLDAPTALRALARLPEDVHLVFLGVRRPALAPADEHAAGAEAVALAGELGLLGTRAHFNADWVPYAERGAWLAGADVAVSAHRDHLETRFAFRTRLLDALWARLPVVATGGDALGELIAARGAGRTVAAGDPAAFAAACAALLADPAPARAAAAALAGELRWDRVAAPLAAFVAEPARRRAPSAQRTRVLRAATLARYRAVGRETLHTDGVPALAARLSRNAARVLRDRLP
ncbi:MAG TPA: glycosyltransferase [Solirubrobacteraceae bacterium]